MKKLSEIDVQEISLVKKPAVPTAKIAIFKGADKDVQSYLQQAIELLRQKDAKGSKTLEPIDPENPDKERHEREEIITKALDELSGLYMAKGGDDPTVSYMRALDSNLGKVLYRGMASHFEPVADTAILEAAQADGLI